MSSDLVSHSNVSTSPHLAIHAALLEILSLVRRRHPPSQTVTEMCRTCGIGQGLVWHRLSSGTLKFLTAKCCLILPHGLFEPQLLQLSNPQAWGGPGDPCGRQSCTDSRCPLLTNIKCNVKLIKSYFIGTFKYYFKTLLIKFFFILRHYFVDNYKMEQ